VLAQSAHSRVYVAHDDNGQVVALKELHFALVPGTAEIDAFEREAKTLESLQLAGTPRFVERFTEGTGVGLRLYLATEFVRGESLADRVSRGPLPEEQVFALARSLLAVLINLQQRSPALFHRDLKPANVMFRDDGEVVLVDFGSARTVEGSRTHRSTLVGTFGYMPPEQLGGTVDRTSDVFALAATLLHAVTGRPPSELMTSGLSLNIPTSVSPQLRTWLQTALAFERTSRFQDARTALAALDAPPATAQAVSTSPWSAPSKYRGFAVLAVLLAVLGGLLAFDAMREDLAPVEAQPVSGNWFSQVKSRCNQLEVTGLMARSPPPAGTEGAGYGAGCYALAGRFADARKLIQALPQGQRATAAWRVFEIAHPVADQGEDAAAGPMMELVLEFWPENYQALYHAGIAEYAQGDTELAKQRLEAFLAAYKQPDNFTNTAKLVLDRIEKGLPADPSMGLGRH
jgi:serine/threonine protein kinase